MGFVYQDSREVVSLKQAKKLWFLPCLELLDLKNYFNVWGAWKKPFETNFFFCLPHFINKLKM